VEVVSSWVVAGDFTGAWSSTYIEPTWETGSGAYSNRKPAGSGVSWSYTGGEDAGYSVLVVSGAWATGLRPTGIRITVSAGSVYLAKMLTTGASITVETTFAIGSPITEFTFLDNTEDITALFFAFGLSDELSQVITNIEFYVPG
jgi:hypothetical protein